MTFLAFLYRVPMKGSLGQARFANYLFKDTKLFGLHEARLADLATAVLADLHVSLADWGAADGAIGDACAAH